MVADFAVDLLELRRHLQVGGHGCRRLNSSGKNRKKTEISNRNPNWLLAKDNADDDDDAA